MGRCHVIPIDIAYSIEEPKKATLDRIHVLVLIIQTCDKKQLRSNCQITESMKYHGVCFVITSHNGNAQIGEKPRGFEGELLESHHVCERPTPKNNL